jgi:hypothetical protein
MNIADKFNTTSDTCADSSSPFSILGFRDEASFFSQNLTGKRPIYIDELQQNPQLSTKVLEYLLSLTSQRGINVDTKYGLVNGWADSNQSVQNCGENVNVGKVLVTKACFPIF